MPFHNSFSEYNKLRKQLLFLLFLWPNFASGIVTLASVAGRQSCSCMMGKPTTMIKSIGQSAREIAKTNFRNEDRQMMRTHERQIILREVQKEGKAEAVTLTGQCRAEDI